MRCRKQGVGGGIGGGRRVHNICHRIRQSCQQAGSWVLGKSIPQGLPQAPQKQAVGQRGEAQAPVGAGMAEGRKHLCLLEKHWGQTPWLWDPWPLTASWSVSGILRGWDSHLLGCCWGGSRPLLSILREGDEGPLFILGQDLCLHWTEAQRDSCGKRPASGCREDAPSSLLTYRSQAPALRFGRGC